MKRRVFIETSAMAAAGLFFLNGCSPAAKKASGVGLQLYTLRDTISKDPKGVLERVASFGYEKLETFGYNDGKIFGLDFGEFGKVVKDLGMKVTSGHYGLDQVTSDRWEKAIEDARSIGQEYMVVPWLNESDRTSIDDYKRICETLNKAGEICNNNGMKFGYHNHAFEFDDMDGQTPFDLMLDETDPKLVHIEMDIYWVVNANRDPLAYFEKYPGRFEQWHVKDMDKNDRQRNADVGAGSIAWKPIFEKAQQSGLKHYYVEQESYPGEPIDSVEASIQYLRELGV